MQVDTNGNDYNDHASWAELRFTVESTVDIDKSGLQAKYDEFKDYVESNYTVESWTEFKMALDNAKAVLDDENATQAAVDNAKIELERAAGLLEEAVILDFSKLEEQISAADLINQNLSKYQDGEEKTAFIAAYQVAKDTLSTAKNQEAIDNAAIALKDAMTALKEIVILDKEELSQAVNEASGLNLDLYKDGSAKDAFKEALANATELLNTATSQAQIDEALEVLNTAMAALEKIEVEDQVNKGALEIAVDIASQVREADLDKVVPAVVNEFRAALDEAKTVLADEEAAQEAVDNAFDRLAQVMWKLEFYKGDKTLLQDLVNKIDALNRADYSEGSWNAMLPVLTEAKDVLADENAMQNEVEESYIKLIKAFLELRLKPNKELLAELIKEAEGLNQANYSEASWQVMVKALENAKNTLVKEEVGYAEVEEAIANLQESIEGLKEKMPLQSGDTVKDSTVKTGDTKGINQITAVMLLAGAAVTLLKRKKIEE